MSHRRLFCTRQHREQMEKSNLGNRRNQLWFALCSFFVFWFFLFYFNSSALISSKHKVHSLVSQESNSPLVTEDGVEHLDRTEPVNQLPVTSKETRFFNRSIVKQKGEETGNRVSVKRNGEESIDQPPLTENGVLPINQTSLTENGSNPEQRFTEKGDDEIVKRPSEAEPVENRGEPVNQLSITENRAKPNSDPCSGQYVYVHNLPSRFNDDMLKECRTLSEWTDMCQFTSNKGLGPPIDNSQGVFSNKGWYATNQFALEVIFNYRMKQYKCLTNDSSLASAVFVPFYAGLDIARYLWGYNISMRDNTTLDLVKWLAARPEWKVLGGKDHFLVAGRITWDFRRLTDKESDWGNRLMLLPEAKNMSMLVIESSPWHSNDFAIPYPTYFHPSTDSEVVQWQNKMRRLRRRFLFSFVGGQRPNLEESIRGQIIDQCRASRRKCKLLECSSGSNKCYNPSNVMKMFQSSVFCLQPQGDSYTRRSAFDSMLAGCIPVFFHPGSAYVQYTWHLPKNYTKYSVFISENDIREGKVSIEKRLLSIPEEEVRAMREEVIQLIPRLIYADPSSKLETLEDAFDLAIQGVIRRANRARMEIREGINSDADFAEDNSWKYNLFGTVGAHEWDPFFSKKKDASS